MKLKLAQEIRSNVTHRTRNSFWWVDLLTTDLDAATAYYGELFNWTFDDAGVDVGGRAAMARRGGNLVAGLMEISHELQELGVQAHWQSYILVDDVTDMTERARELGATVVMEPSAVEDSGWMSAIIDPTGAAFMFWQAHRHEGAELIDRPGSLTWLELRTPDTAAARAFYEQLLGWKAVRDDSGAMEYWRFQLDGVDVGGLMTMGGMSADIPAHWNVIFAVEDAQRAADVTRAHGGEVYYGPANLRAGTVVVVADAQGVPFSVVEPYALP